MPEFKVTFDPEADAAYIYVVQQIPPGEAVKQVACDDDVVLDYDRSGQLLGIEVLSASRLLPPELLKEAKRPDKQS